MSVPGASGLSVLCSRHPTLTDVWINHLPTLLLPNELSMRKHMSIALYEMMDRMDNYEHWDEYRDLHWEAKYRSFWLNETVVVLVNPRVQGHYHLHLSDTGIVHCSTVVNIDYRGYLFPS
jgi:hypothetical protein